MTDNIISYQETSSELLQPTENVLATQNGETFRVYMDGAFLGVQETEGGSHPIYIPRSNRVKNHYIIGQTGTGKTTAMSVLAMQDILNGHGCCILDPHGDIIESVRKHIPAERQGDIVIIDSENLGGEFGYNIFQELLGVHIDYAIQGIKEIFGKIFGYETFGPRMQEYLTLGILTLLEDKDEVATLLDLPRLFEDNIYREGKVAKVTTIAVKKFWEEIYGGMGEEEGKSITPRVTSMFSFFNDGIIHNIIGKEKPTLRMRQIVDEGKILLVNLAKSRIGEINSQFLGMLLVLALHLTTHDRSNLDENKRNDFYIYVDEFHTYLTTAFVDMMSRAQTNSTPFVVAHQYLAQLTGENNSFKDAVFSNIGILQSFYVGSSDALDLAKIYNNEVTAEQIRNLPQYASYCKIFGQEREMLCLCTVLFV